jgi:hypothetical protein
VKVAGDKGADTVKLVFQICNVPNPNSVQNTCVFVYSVTPVRGKEIRLFMSGDYEFLGFTTGRPPPLSNSWTGKSKTGEEVQQCNWPVFLQNSFDTGYN